MIIKSNKICITKQKTLAIKDNKKTYNSKNIKFFRNEIKKILNSNQNVRIYDNLTEIEHYAVRGLYYSIY